MPNRKWTEKELNFLRKHYRKMSCVEIAYRLDRTELAVRAKGGVLGIARSRAFTDEEIAVVRELYADHTNAAIAERLGCKASRVISIGKKLGLKKDPEFIRELGRFYSKEPKAVEQRFKKAHEPVNKGLRRPGWYRGRMRETQFVKGQPPGNAVPIGTEVFNDGYVRIKTTEGNGVKNFEFKHRIVWEKHHGPIPKGHVVVFRDGNSRNCDPSNLELITRAELARRNHHSNLPPEVRELIRTLAKFRRRLNDYAKKQD